MRETSDSPPERKSLPIFYLSHISLPLPHKSGHLSHIVSPLSQIFPFSSQIVPPPLSHIAPHTIRIFTPYLPNFVNITPPSEFFSKKRHCSVCGGRSACRTHRGGETVIYIYILMGWDLLWVPLHLDFAAISFSEILNYEKKFWIIFPQNISVIDCR